MIKSAFFLVACCAGSLLSGALLADDGGLAGKCRVRMVADDSGKPSVDPPKWTPAAPGSKDTFQLIAACEPSEVAVGGGFHWNNPHQSQKQIREWIVVGADAYQSRQPQTFADGWICLAQYKDTDAGDLRPRNLWCSVTCCPRW